MYGTRESAGRRAGPDGGVVIPGNMWRWQWWGREILWNMGRLMWRVEGAATVQKLPFRVPVYYLFTPPSRGNSTHIKGGTSGFASGSGGGENLDIRRI